MTFAQAQALVIEFCKVNVNDTNLLTLVQDALNIALYDVAREGAKPEFLIVNSPISLASIANGMVLIPDNLDIERIIYKNNSPVRQWPLTDKEGLVPPAPIWGKPRAYCQVSADLSVPTPLRLALYPYDLAVAPDSLLLDYYAVPLLFSAMGAGTTYTSSRWDNEIIRRANHYVLTYQGKLDQAKENWSEQLALMGRQNPTPPQS